MPYLTKQNVTAININGESIAHPAATVLSDWELSDFIREKIKEGSSHYRESYEPLTENEAHSYRVKATMAQTPRQLDTEKVDAPWDDYVGLHPTEITDRLRDASLGLVEQCRKFERAGLNRSQIVDYVAPAEREPWEGYDILSVTDVLDKFAISSDSFVKDSIAYERAHKNREAIVGYDREIYEGSDKPKTAGAAPTPVTA